MKKGVIFMLNNIRYKIATRFAKKADEYINKGDFESILKGLKYFKISIMIVPPSKELTDVKDQLIEIAIKHPINNEEKSQ